MSEVEKHISIIERMMFAFATSTVDKKPIFPTLKYCKEALREKLERENPQPLGLEELRKMDGEPVWIEVIGKPDLNCWGYHDEDGVNGYTCFTSDDDYGKANIDSKVMYMYSMSRKTRIKER